MIHDSFLQFSAAQAVTASASSTNVVDLSLNRNIGVGENLYVGVVVVTALVGAGVTVQVNILGGSTTTPATLRQTMGTFAAAAAAGTSIIARLQPNVLIDRYISLQYQCLGGALTGGAFTSFLTHDIDAFTAYASGFVIN